ncbi:MAG: iron-regulated protein [Myxococcales bacterium]|nr:iron-regulated protein [Myxococcales bacterium]
MPLRTRLLRTFALLSCLVPLAAACSESSSSPASPPAASADAGAADAASSTEEARAVLVAYAAGAHGAYSLALERARAMQTAIDAMLAAPSQATLDAARAAWIAAREPYGRTEVYRFFGGPIDEDESLEGRINSWPLDEAFIDYTKDAPTSGIVNAAAPAAITRDFLKDQNTASGEKNVTTGYHAIEFLLWGQDLSPDGPGARPHTDFDTGSAGTASNQDRRGEYLRVVTELLVSDLQGLTDTWTESGDYRATFTALDTHEALTNMLLGMGSLSGAELSGERMTVAFDTQDQEDEHSCFSDNTHADLAANLAGIEDVYLGRAGGKTGPSIDALVGARAPALQPRVKASLDKTRAAIAAIPVPFDRAIFDPAGRDKIKAALDACEELTNVLLEVGLAFGARVQLPK